MAVSTIPEILRINLTSVVLQLLTIGIKKIVDFDFIDKPKPDVMHQFITLIKLLILILSVGFGCCC